MRRGNKRHIALAEKFWSSVELDWEKLSVRDTYRVLAQMKRFNPARYDSIKRESALSKLIS